MNPAILKRLSALEQRPAKKQPVDQKLWEEQVIAESGLSREQMQSTYGGFPGYIYWKLMNDVRNAPPSPIPAKYRSAQEYYMAMLRGEA